MKYHEFDNLKKYKVAKDKGFTTRYQAVDGIDFNGRYDDHEIRDLMPKIDVYPGASILVCGTGTGADSCWLADQGFNVTGVDLIQDAIDIAVRMAAERSCPVRFVRDNLVNMQNEYGIFDVIVDSACLQNIVTDDERKSVFDFVHNHLKPGGFYMIMCAGYSTSKDYSDSIREEDTGIVYMRTDKEHEDLEDIKVIGGHKYVLTRRHHTLTMLIEELKSSGFQMEWSATEDESGRLRVIVRHRTIQEKHLNYVPIMRMQKR